MTFGSKNVHWTGNRVPKQLQPKDTRTIRIGMFNDQDGQWDYVVDGNALTTTLVIGDNFIVNAKARNLEDVNFWLISYTKPLHQVRRAFTNKWGSPFVVGGNCG